jgi:DNA-binding CsgD family transcriptional regulator
VPLLLVDGEGRLLNANMAGARELAQGRLLKREGEHVRAAAAADRASFGEVLQRAAADHRRQAWQGGAVSVSPVAREPRRGEGTAPALLLLVLPAEASIAEACRLFAYQYELSAAELAVLHGVVHGQSPAQIAHARGTLPSTVRGQLARLRHKCGEDLLGTLLPRARGPLVAAPPLGGPRQRK